MLSKPFAGWVNINIGKCRINASYLTDVPFDLLNGFIDCMVNYKTVVINFDEEGSDGYLVLNGFVAYVFTVREDVKAQNDQVYVDDLARELVKDIQDNIDDWARWDTRNEPSDDPRFCGYENEVATRQAELIGKCKLIEYILDRGYTGNYYKVYDGSAV